MHRRSLPSIRASSSPCFVSTSPRLLSSSSPPSFLPPPCLPRSPRSGIWSAQQLCMSWSTVSHHWLCILSGAGKRATTKAQADLLLSHLLVRRALRWSRPVDRILGNTQLARKDEEAQDQPLRGRVSLPVQLLQWTRKKGRKVEAHLVLLPSVLSSSLAVTGACSLTARR